MGYLNIILGRENCDANELYLDSSGYFKEYKKPEWFETDFAKRAIKAIDNADVLFEEALMNQFGHGFSTEKLSSGVKTLLLIKFGPEHIYYGSMMGDNCVPFLMEIAKEREKDTTILLEHFMDFPYEYEGMLKLNGEPISIDDYEDAVATWSCRFEKIEYYFDENGVYHEKSKS